MFFKFYARASPLNFLVKRTKSEIPCHEIRLYTLYIITAWNARKLVSDRLAQATLKRFWNRVCKKSTVLSAGKQSAFFPSFLPPGALKTQLESNMADMTILAFALFQRPEQHLSSTNYSLKRFFYLKQSSAQFLKFLSWIVLEIGHIFMFLPVRNTHTVWLKFQSLNSKKLFCLWQLESGTSFTYYLQSFCL